MMTNRTHALWPLAALLLGVTVPATLAAAAGFQNALQLLQRAQAGSTSQVTLQEAWREVAQADTRDLPEILAAMDATGPLGENWLRAAADAVAERAVARREPLPIDQLEVFFRDQQHAPRARRVAYEWILQRQPEARERLLGELLDDPSLELRYDAVQRILNLAEAATGDRQRALYSQAFQAALDIEQVRLAAAALEKLGREADLVRHLGLLTTWQTIGPFDNTERAGFAAIYPPEQELDFSATYAGKDADGSDAKLRWQQHATDDKEGTVDLNTILRKEKDVVAYAVATIVSPSKQELQCRWATLNASKLWVNGQLVATHEVYHAHSEMDQYVADIQLRPGENTILLKLCQNEQTQSWAEPWEFQLRVTDALGRGQQFPPTPAAPNP